MKKIIEGKMYNTDTAECVGEWHNGYFANDIYYCAEELYRKKTGEFFLFGCGGALSRYATHSGNNSGWGDKVIPLSYSEAQKWAEKHLDGDGYERIFGEVVEDDTITMGISVTKAVADLIKRNASNLNMTVSDYVAMRCTE